MGRRTAEEVLAEIGPNMDRFPTKAHLASWARLCPGNNESGGKRKGRRTGQGNPWLRAALVEAAWGAAHTRDTYLSAQYHRLASRRGGKRAVVAVAHSILGIVYPMLRDGSAYQDLGGNYFDERDGQGAIRRAVRRMERLGFKVTLLYVNLFQPVLKPSGGGPQGRRLVVKEREGAKVRKRYDMARTPYQRLLAYGVLGATRNPVWQNSTRASTQ